MAHNADHRRPQRTQNKPQEFSVLSCVWLKIKELGLRSFSLCGHLPGLQFGQPLLTQVKDVDLRAED